MYAPCAYDSRVVMMMQQPQIILLKEGTDTSQGKPHLVSNINACVAVADVVRTTLGPRGMDKLIHDVKVGGDEFFCSIRVLWQGRDDIHTLVYAYRM